MTEWIIKCLAEAAVRTVGGIVILPITYLFMHLFVWCARQWVDVPDLTNGQVFMLAFAVMMFGR